MINSRIFILYIMGMLLTLASCIQDGISTSPSDQISFSTDTLDIGVVYTDELTTTNRMVVYNRNSKGLNISRISISGENASMFRMNVDGMSGKEFADVEVRARDSIFVFVEAQLPENGNETPTKINASMDFVCNGIASKVVLSATGQDVRRLNAVTIAEDTRLTSGVPYRVIDSLVVAEGVKLDIEPGTRILFHDKAKLVVRGTLRAIGTPEAPILLTGDRTGDVIPNVSFDLMSRQWDGVGFLETSCDNWLEYAEISNTVYGVEVVGDGSDLDVKKLTLVNSKLRNSGNFVLSAFNASVEAYGCEFAEAAEGLVVLTGGKHRFDQCTAANNYLFAAVANPAWIISIADLEFEDIPPIAATEALITNTITHGYGGDVEPGDLTGSQVFFKRCMFKSNGEDDENFVDCLWDQDPLFYTVRNEYLFDYRLKPDSPAIGVAFEAYSEHPLSDRDFYGEARKGDLGAYAFVAPSEE